MKKALVASILILTLAQIPVFADSTERAGIYYNNGITYLKDKKYTSAISEFKKVARTNPYDKTVREMLATAYLSRAQYYKDTEKAYKKAINDYRSAIVYLKYWDEKTDASKEATVQKAIDNLNYLKKMYAPLKTAEAVNNEAKSLRSQGELAASIYEYTMLFSNGKYELEAYKAASDIYKSLRNDKMATECAREATKADPKDGMAHFKYALILDEIGNEDAAMDEFSRALQYSDNNKELLTALQNLWMARSVQDPKDSQALINLGAILQKQGQYDLARAQYIKARQINPNDPVILNNLASVNMALNDYDGAIKIYDEMILKNPNDITAKLYRAQLYNKKGNKEAAMAEYRAILKSKPDNAEAQSGLNSILAGLSGEQLAGYLEQEAVNNPTNYDAQFKYAFEMHKNKKYSAAVEFYKRAINADKSQIEPYINLAQIYLINNNTEKASNIISQGLNIAPENKELAEMKDNIEKQGANDLYAKGLELYNSKDFTDAIAYFKKIPYQTPEILTMIGNCYYELNQTEGALDYYTKALQKDPKNESVLYMTANILMNNKKNDEAKVYINKILAINPNNNDAKTLLNALNEGEEGGLLDSAIKLYEAKNFDEGLNVLNKLISKNSKNPYAYYYKGAIYDEMGNIDKAIVEYKKSINADPNFTLGYYMTAVGLDNKENYKEACEYYDKYVMLKGKEGVDDEFTKYAKSRTKELKDYLSQK